MKNKVKLLVWILISNFSFSKSRRLKYSTKIKIKYKKKIEFSRIKFVKVNAIQIDNFLYEDFKDGMVLSVQTIIIHVKFGFFLADKFRILNLEILNGNLSIKSESDPNRETTLKTEKIFNPQAFLRGFYASVDNMLTQIIVLSFKAINVEKFLVIDKRTLIETDIAQFKLTDHKYYCDLIVKIANLDPSRIIIEGDLMPLKKSIHFSLTAKEIFFYNSCREKVHLNKLRIDALKISSSFQIYSKTKKYLYVNIVIRGFSINWDALSDKEISNQDMHLDIKSKKDDKGFFIDKISSFGYNNLFINIGFEHRFLSQDRVELFLNLNKSKMLEILTSFPEMFFSKKMKDSFFLGAVEITFELNFLLNNPNDKTISLTKEGGLVLESKGDFDLLYLNYPFYHSIFDNGHLIKTIQLDKSNPKYTNLEKVSKSLIDAVICLEDPNFYVHKGIDTEGLALAIFTNIATGKFSRGGSTITMQLARNLYLNHKKNGFRKLDEYMITWLLEDVFKIKKNRLLEIYLNIIELGPNIYGIEEASNFYFSKSANELTLTQSFVLTYIIPRPKFFLDAVRIKSPVLAVNLFRHFQYLSKKMLKNGMVCIEEIENLEKVIIFSNNLGEINIREV
ncbi:biosynthetic peptidoglycan transglycosylase [Pedobacter roseus]|uniref:Transglycosylase domain-containing protein n=1 Tax=Pedobacter roseus TaxID=336820 RepID=A0A7G9QKT9_9SPHI|nr:biosynthetic peptidoglycan transglycosylase [Pedobacter roseus]QNN43964.1 transglycosylase domain-containing protein [Pedobacter roseus]